MGETRVMNRDRVIRRRTSQSSDFPFSPLLLEMGVRSTCSVFFFLLLSSFASFVTFLRRREWYRREEKVCVEGGGGKIWCQYESVVSLLLSLSSPWWARGIESVRRAWREKEKRLEGGLLLRRLHGPTREWESNHWQKAWRVRGASPELLSFSQLGRRRGEEQNKWNKIGKRSASTANPRRRLGSNISIMLWAGTALDWFQTRLSTTTSLLSFTLGWRIFVTLSLCRHCRRRDCQVCRHQLYTSI